MNQGSSKPAAQDGLHLIAPSFEESPTYLATHESSDRAKRLCREVLVMDTLFSGVYPLQWKNADQFDSVMGAEVDVDTESALTLESVFHELGAPN